MRCLAGIPQRSASTTQRRDSVTPFVVGLTGGIASGKTAASDRLAQHGVIVVDTDVIARRVVEPGTAGFNDIVAHFGRVVVAPDGHLDRAALRQRVFADANERLALERMTHPRIREQARREVVAASGLYCILVVPLLVESPLSADVDRILVIDCPDTVQLARLLARDSVDEATARAMIAAQSSRDDRRAVADDIVVNDQTVQALARSIDALHRFYRTLAALRR